MEQILIACGDVELLRKIASDLPDGRYKPIATKSGDRIAPKIAKRDVRIAVVHEELADGPGAALCAELRQLPSPPSILFLSSSAVPDDGPFDRALRYPVPGPVFRNMLARLAPAESASVDRERWRAFYDELKARAAKIPGQNYYEILGVPTDAKHHRIVAVYDRLSLRYHPDRYSQYRSEGWGQKIYDHANEIYKEMTDAFSVLSDRRLKKKYDAALARGELRLDSALHTGGDVGPDLLENAATTAQGKKFLRLAERDIARRDWTAALQNLRFAQSIEPEVAVIEEKIAEVESRLADS